MKLLFLFLTGIFSVLLVLGCGLVPNAQPDGPTQTSALIDQSASSSQADAGQEVQPRVLEQLKLPNYQVDEGSLEHVSAGTEIIAEKGIEITGTLSIDDGTDGDIVLTAETGDIVISGSVIVNNEQATLRQIGGKLASYMPSSNAVDSRITSQVRSANPQPGVSIVLTARQGDIVLKRYTLLQSGDGQSAIDARIVSWGGVYEATNGAPGGDIVLRAPNGVIRLPSDRKRGDPALFGLGNGGSGADVEVDRNAFNTDETTLGVKGGNGGRSGRLITEPADLEGVPKGGDLFDMNMRLVSGGEGGDGGYAVWIDWIGGSVTLDQNGWLVGTEVEDLPIVETPLEAIGMFGGDGGSGARVGGDGGVAGYIGWQNVVGGPVADIESFGGDGGDIFSSPVPIVGPIGGNGGGFYVHGGLGWDGGVAKDGREYRDGPDGSDVFGKGGSGGRILGDASQFPGGMGGNGGGAPSRSAGKWGWGAKSGSGGYGMFACKVGGRGGEGGNGGNTTAWGGDGGRGPLDGTRGERGGDGGDVTTRFGSPLYGGDGNPAGAGGDGGSIDVQPGRGGAGSTPGKDGRWLGPDFEPPKSNEPGKLCEGDSAAPAPDAPPFDFSCRAVSNRKSGTIPPHLHNALSRCIWQLYDATLVDWPSDGPGKQRYSLTRNDERVKAYNGYLADHPEIKPGG